MSEFVPHPIGTLVRGIDPDGVIIRQSCTWHIFETLTEPEPVDYGCGWIQGAQCLVCETTIPKISAAWYYHEANDEDIGRCLVDVTEEILRLTHVKERITRRHSKLPIVNLDDA